MKGRDAMRLGVAAGVLMRAGLGFSGPRTRKRRWC